MSYVDDVPYVRQFVADLAPARLRLATALSGIRPPPAVDFDYLELGCGHGDTLVALAAANSHSRFVGVDLMRAHVASGRRLARDAALDNVGFLERDFGKLEDEVGEQDYIVAHGVLSWIGAAEQRALIDFARRKLKPGGLLYLSYNALPGWSAVEPLRQIIASAKAPDSLERARRGIELARALERMGAQYFVRHPTAKEKLETLARAPLPYVVHEYLHEDWTPFYFAHVARSLAEAGLSFAGALPIEQNLRETAVAPSFDALFESVPDRLTFESLKDFANNTYFRKDIFVRGSAERDEGVAWSYLDGTTWGLLTARPDATATVALRHRTLALDALCGELLAALARQPSTGAALADVLRRPPAEIRAALPKLLAAELVVPWTLPPRPKSKGDRLRFVSEYDRATMARIGDEAPLLLASPVLGTALNLSATERLALRAVTEAAAADRERWTRELVETSVMRIRVGERVVSEPAEQRAVIAAAIDELVATRVDKLVEFGILV